MLPGTRVHIDFCDTLWSLQLVFGHVVAGPLSDSSLPHFEGELCHGCNRALSPDATPLNCGDSMPSGAALMHTYACHQCDPSSARFVATSTLRPTQSFTVDSDVVVVARLSVDRAPLDTTQVGKDGGNTGALPSIDRVGRGLASQRLSTSRVIPERPKCYNHCAAQSRGRHSWGKAAPSASRTDERRH